MKSTNHETHEMSNDGPFPFNWHRIILLMFILGLLLTLISTLFMLNHKTVRVGQTAKPTIALVNEDHEGKFNGANYNFGKALVNLVSNDSHYNWQVVSRAVAQKAYDDQSVQAVIYLPQNFTKNLLTLQAIAPQKAEVAYSILNTPSKLTDKQLQDKILTVLHDFNTSVVKMYYASVVGNVANAQTNMNQMVESQANVLTNLKQHVYRPFQITDQSYGNVVSGVIALKSQNESWLQAQNNFTTAVTSMLKDDSASLNGTLPTLSNYFTTQQKITDTNLTNANLGIANQASADQNFDKHQWDKGYQMILGELSQFKSDDEVDGETGLLSELKSKVADYNTKISDMSTDLGQQITTLKDKRNDLLALENALYAQFFDQTIDPNSDETNFSTLKTTSQARKALAKLVGDSFSTEQDNITGSGYESTIAKLISKFSVAKGDYESLLSTLVTNGSLSKDKKSTLETQLDILQNYAKTANLTTGTVDFSDLPTVNDTTQTFTKKFKINVPANQKETLQLTSSDDTNQTTTATFGLTPANKMTQFAGHDQFSYLTDLFSQIKTATALITLLYGAPGADDSTLTGVINFKKDAATNSIFKLYGNVASDQVAQRLSDDDVTTFRKMGEDNIAAVVKTVDQLNETITGLQANKDKLDAHLPNDYFDATLTRLIDWYHQTMDKVNTAYQAWQINPTSQLKTQSWKKFKSDKPALYFDKASGDSLYETINQLITSSSQQAKQTAIKAQLIKDNSAQFNTMVNLVNQTQADAKTVIAKTSKLLDTGETEQKQNQSYLTNFSTVLSNSRTPGVDRNKIYNFFAAPIATKNVTKATGPIKAKLDWRWLIVLGIGVLIGNMTTLLFNSLMVQRPAKNRANK